MGQSFVRYTPVAIPIVEETFIECETTLRSNKEVLITYVPVRPMAENLISQFCSNDTVSKQYGAVKIFFGANLAEQIEFIAKGIADVILAKDVLVAAFEVEQTQNYKPLVSFKQYSAYFISLREKPQLTKHYLIDKRIGLLDYPTSRSGHILPMQQLKQLDLDVENMNITYASTHSELRKLLMSGAVDIISSYWQDEDKANFSEQYITPIAQNIDGTKWYFKMTENNIELACALQKQLVRDAVENRAGYFSEPATYWQCDSLPYMYVGNHNE